MVALALAVSVFLADPPQILKLEPSSARVEVQNAAVDDGTVRGTLVNETETPIKSVTLLVQHHYRWPNEYKPGPVDPGRSESVTVSTEIPPHGRVTFASPVRQPEPVGDGGHFDTTVSVMAFEQVFPPEPVPEGTLPPPTD